MLYKQICAQTPPQRFTKGQPRKNSPCDDFTRSSNTAESNSRLWAVPDVPPRPRSCRKVPVCRLLRVNVHFTVTVTMLYVFKVEAACLRPPLLMLTSASRLSSHNIKPSKLTCYMSAAWRGCILKLAWLNVLLSCCLNLCVSFLNGHQRRRGLDIIAK